jgi:hypothetical protein
VYIFLEENLKGRDVIGNLNVGGRIILIQILKEFNVKKWNGLNCLGIRSNGGP